MLVSVLHNAGRSEEQEVEEPIQQLIVWLCVKAEVASVCPQCSIEVINSILAVARLTRDFWHSSQRFLCLSAA